jgi:hypothetical protein
MYQALINKITGGSNYNEGSCGDLIRTVKAFADAIEPCGVISYDGDLVHIVGRVGDQYFDCEGSKTADQIRSEWSYGHDPDLVQIVPVELDGDTYRYGDMTISAEIINQ